MASTAQEAFLPRFFLSGWTLETLFFFTIRILPRKQQKCLKRKGEKKRNFCCQSVFFFFRFTGSQWDHAGIVLRWADNGLKLFEATAGGVGLYNLQVFQKIY